MDFSKAELERYSRQILYFGKAGQTKLKAARVLVIGAGGIGSPLLMSLAAAGAGQIHIIDADVVDRSNLSRQTLYTENDIGQNKAEAAARKLQTLNPHIEIIAHTTYFQAANAAHFMVSTDLTIEGSDDIASKFLASDTAVGLHKPVFISGIGADQGHIFPCWPGQACYRCYFANPPPPGELPTCASAGVLSPLPHIFGAHLAYLAVQFLAASEKPSLLYLVDRLRWRTIPLRQNPSCTVCFSA